MARGDFASVLKEAAKKFDTRIAPLTGAVEDVEALSSGNLAIDHILGVGGFPRGRSVELYGPPSCGKTTSAIQAAVHAQQNDLGRVLYLDHEQAFDETYARSLGLQTKVDSFLLAQPDSFEDGANMARMLTETGGIAVIIFDSVAAMTPKVMLDMDTALGNQVAPQARLMSQFLQAINPVLAETNTTAIFLNQLREQIGPGMKSNTTPGGKALKFYASVRVEYTPIQQIQGTAFNVLTNENEKRVVGNKVKVRVTKNKVAPPFKTAVILTMFGKGFVNEWTALQVMIAHGVVKKSGAYLTFPNNLVTEDFGTSADGKKRYLHGEAAVLSHADRHPKWRDEVIASAKNLLAADHEADPVEVTDDETDDEAS